MGSHQPQDKKVVHFCPSQILSSVNQNNLANHPGPGSPLAIAFLQLSKMLDAFQGVRSRFGVRSTDAWTTWPRFVTSQRSLCATTSTRRRRRRLRKPVSESLPSKKLGFCSALFLTLLFFVALACH